MGSRLEANSSAVRKRIEKHKFEDEDGEEYSGSKFGGFNDYFRRKKIKLQNLDAELRASSSSDHPPIFRGVVVHVNGYTQPSLNDLHALVVTYGGGFMQYLDGKTTVTHVIASNLTPKKKVEFSRYRIVKPAWIVDSIEAGRLLPWDAYRVVDEGVGQQILGFDKGSVISQANRSQTGYKEQTNTSWYTGQVQRLADQLDGKLGESNYSNHETNGLASGVRVEAAGHSDTECSAGVVHEPLPINEYSEFDSPTRSHKENQFCHPPESSSPNIADQPSPESVDRGPLRTDHEPINRLPKDTPAGSGDNALGADHDMLHEGRHSVYALGTLPLTTKKKAELIPPKLETNKIDVSAEEHNALLLADPKVWKSTVVNPGFLKQYYEESRLHHLSAWKAELKSQLQALAAEKSCSQKSRQKRPSGSRRYILHVDFDSFFAAVSLKKFPHYVDKPVVIAHGGGSGSEIASCNYPAREFGIKNGMWMKHAQKMCPDLKVLPYDFKAYEEASRQFYEAAIATGGVVQSVSVDEALVDISNACVEAGGHGGLGVHEASIWREQAKADDIAQNLRDTIQKVTGCAVSIGIGGNILLAKVALRKAKPAGQYHIKPEEVLDFIGNITVQELPGVAYSIGGKLEDIGVKYVKDVRSLTKEKIISTLGPKTGEKIWDYSRGIDKVEVGEQVIRKSVSAEVNWGIRFVTQDQADEFVQSLCEELHKRLIAEKVKGRQLTMKIMRRAADAPLDPPKHLGHGKCDTFNKSVVLGVSTNEKQVLYREAISIMRGWGFSPGELRGIGVQMTNLEPLKGTTESTTDNSQKRLPFVISAVPRTAPLQQDPIDDITSPQKPQGQAKHPAAALAPNIPPGGKLHSPLNVHGTQFVIPSQIDPAVLSELPEDIRLRLMRQETTEVVDVKGPSSPPTISGSKSPSVASDASPINSQLDAEALQALPEDVRAEVLASHRDTRTSKGQTVLPQSPHKSRIINIKKQITPTKSRKRSLLFSRTKAESTLSTLTQSNFIANKPQITKSRSEEDKGFESVEISDEFLSALPPEIRSEVLAQSRRDRLQKRGGIDLSASRTIKKAQPAQTANGGQRKLQLTPRPAKATFTALKLTELPELRGAIDSWFQEFVSDGPYEEDVDMLVEYLRKVVQDEQNMAKAVAVVKWLAWTVEEAERANEVQEQARGIRKWKSVLSKVRDSMQKAVKGRGLGRMDL